MKTDSKAKPSERALAEKLRLAVKAIQSSIRYSPYDKSLQEAFSKLNEVILALEAESSPSSTDMVESIKNWANDLRATAYSFDPNRKISNRVRYAEVLDAIRDVSQDMEDFVRAADSKSKAKEKEAK